jgi:predicted DNA-binding protein (UPF0251 family)
MPMTKTFGPLDKNLNNESIEMTVEEYESIRLMDLEEMDQNGCAEFMGIARSTFQRIYSEARKKMAESLVNGKVLVIEGGSYTLCSHNRGTRHCGRLCKWEVNKNINKKE